MLEIERKAGEEIELLLGRLYIEERMTLKEMGTELGVDYSTVWGWLQRLGFTSRRVRTA